MIHAAHNYSSNGQSSPQGLLVVTWKRQGVNRVLDSEYAYSQYDRLRYLLAFMILSDDIMLD